MKKAVCLIIIGSLLVMPCSQALAGHGSGHYRYDNGRYHRNGSFWFGIGATTLVLGAVIASLAPRYELVVVNGVTYYYKDGVYYVRRPGGYVVVQQPLVAQQPIVVQQPIIIQQSALMGETFVVNIPNNNGTYTSVTLVKSNNGYIGPQGEFYPGHPSIDQLRVIYGK
jgi:hypothetical protein